MSHASSVAKPWVPASCLTSDRAVRPFAKLVADWSKNWLARQPEPSWHVHGCWKVEGSASTIGWQTLAQDGALAICGRSNTLEELALAILGVKAQASLTPSDMSLMWPLAEEAVDDLLRTFGKAVALRTGDCPTAYRLSVGPAAGPCLALRLPQSVLASKVRESFAPMHQGGELLPRSEASREQSVVFGAHLGSAQLNIAALTSLECGDVIVLDRSSSACFGLMVNDRASELPLRLARDDQSLTLQFETTQ